MFFNIFIDEEKCVACRACEKICPAKAISVNKKARIDYFKCIACFACVNICSRKAIKIKYAYRV